MATRVFIVDDHFMVIEGIRNLLYTESSIEWIGYAMTAKNALDFLQSCVVDIILLDINLPDKSGVDLCADIKKRFPNVKIIGLSTFNQLSFIENMIRNGASGYLLKNATKEEIIKAISVVMDGKSYYSNEVEDLLVSRNEAFPGITRRESEVLELIALGMTNTEIAEKIFVSVSTVDSHRKNLILKLEAKNTADLVRIAFTFGLIK